jgi:hypothetical protein
MLEDKVDHIDRFDAVKYDIIRYDMICKTCKKYHTDNSKQ